MSDNLSSAKIMAVVGVAAAAAVTSIGLYLYLKEEDDDQLFYRHVRRVKQTDTSFSLIDRVRVRKDVIGNVIGRGGEVVKKIQSATRTRIHFDEDKDGSGDKWATISGTEDGIENAKDMIQKIVSEKSADNVFTEEVSVPWHLVGNLIGREGSTIKAMCKSSGAKINVPRSSSQPISGYIPVEVKGSIEQINEARRQINQIISSDIRPKANGFRDAERTAAPAPVPKPAVAVAPPVIKTSNDEMDTSFRREVWDLWDEEPLREELIPVQEDMLHVYVSHVESPSRFWVQVFGPKSTALDKLSNEMTDHYEVNSRKEKVTSIKVGDIVAAPYTTQDETWYRVRITEITERHPADDSDVRVYYLDFGGDAVHKRKSLCTLKHEFLIALPFQAIECCLNGVQPLTPKTENESSNKTDAQQAAESQEVQNESGDKKVKWSEEATMFFAEACHSSEWVEVLVRPHEKQKSCVPVDVLDFKDKSSGRIDVAELMISKGFAQRAEVNGVATENGHASEAAQSD